MFAACSLIVYRFASTIEIVHNAIVRASTRTIFESGFCTRSNPVSDSCLKGQITRRFGIRDIWFVIMLRARFLHILLAIYRPFSLPNIAMRMVADVIGRYNGL